MPNHIFLSTLLLALAYPAVVLADLVVIANPAAGTEKMKLNDVVNIFMGRLRMFPSGLTAQPLDLPPDAPGKATFYRQLVGKDLADIDAYWARLVFSGNTQPPRTVLSEEAVVEHVAYNRNAIGYVDRGKVDKRVRVVLELTR